MRTDRGRLLALAAVSVVLPVLFFSWKATEDIGTERDKGTIIGRLLAQNTSRRFLAAQGERAKDTDTETKAKATETSSPITAAKDAVLSCGIAGVIRNEDNEPVKEAKITVRSNGKLTGKEFETDASGHYTAEGIIPGTYDILVGHPKYVTLIRPNYIVNQLGKFIQVNFNLPLGASIDGIVKDEEGKPLKGVKAGAKRRKMEQFVAGDVYLDDATYKTQQTDSAGTFTLRGVALGPNVFEFRKAGYELEKQNIDITPEKATKKLEIVLKKTGKISGLVLQAEGKPLSTASVSLTRYKPFGGAEEKLQKEKFTTVTDATGKFFFGKLFNEGFYDIMVEHENFAPGIYPLVSVGTDKLTCVMETGGRIEGRTQYIDRVSTPASVMLKAESVIKGTTFTQQLMSNGTGNFAFDHLPYGTYKVMVDSLDFAGEPKTDLPCTKEKPLKDVIVEVYESCIVRGRVSDSQTDTPVGGAGITLSSTYANGRAKTFMAKSNMHGDFEFRKVPAGVHNALAVARGFIRRTTDRSQVAFVLAPGEKKSDVALLLDHGGSVEGFVMDTRGRTLNACDVQLFSPFGGPDMKNLKARTDSTGYFKIWGIDVGERLMLYASVKRSGYAKKRSDMMTLTAKKSDGSVQVVLEPGGMITGKVVDQVKMPVPGTQIVFTSSEFPNDPSGATVVAYSKSDGTFRIPNCTAGRGRVDAARSGFIKQGRDFTITEGKPTENVNFTLERGLRIQGTVASLDGTPIANATVRARPLEGARGSDDDITNKKGEFLLTNLGPGAFELEATFKLPTADGELSYRFLNRRVAAGTNSCFIDCDLGNTASGFVQDEASKGIPAFSVSLHSRGDTKPVQDFTFNFDKAFSATKGMFRLLNAPRGVYSLSVSAEGYEPYSKSDVYVGPHRNTTIGVVELKAAGGFFGNVVSSTTGKPVSGVSVRVMDATIPEADARKSAPVITSNASGEFRMSTAKAGTYILEFVHPSYMTARLDGIIVKRKTQSDLGRFTLDAGGAVQGTIVDDDGRAVSGAQVYISGIYPRKETRTDAGGNYLLQGVRPGRWPVVAKGDVNSRKVYAFTTVGVTPDESEQADFRLETSAFLEGMVRASTEGTVKSGTVRIHPYDENANVLEDIHYDAKVKQQRFSIASVPPGQYFLWMTGLGNLGSFTIWNDVFLNRGLNDRSVDVPGGKLTGRVTDAAGVSPSGIGLQLFPLNNFKISQSLYNSLMRTAVTGKGGKFAFNCLVPGNYQILYQDPTAADWMALPPLTLNDGDNIGNYDIRMNGIVEQKKP